MLEVEDVQAYYGTAHILDGTSLTVNDDEVLGLLGRNGMGKTTLVRTIAGIDPFVHSDALWAYVDGARPCATGPYRQGDLSRAATNMCDVSAALSEDEIEAIAEHYAALPFVAAEQDFDPGLAASGQAVHAEQCARRHSDGGSNAADEASILAGQWMGYLRVTFAQYASGEREQPAKMQEKMDALSADDVEALIHYYASQQ